MSLKTSALEDGTSHAAKLGMRGRAPGEGRGDAAIAEIARMLNALPAVLPASGSCAPLEPKDLTFSRREPEVVAPTIPFERLQTFPDIEPPMALPPPPPSAGAIMLLAPIPPGSAVPWSEARPERRWGARVLDLMVVLATAALLTVRSPLAEHPVVHPYAQAATVSVAEGWHLVGRTVERGVAMIAERTR